MSIPYLGIGLRPPHYSQILKGKTKVQWFEIISENFMDTGGRPRSILEKIRSQFSIGMHGVSLNIGSPDPLHKTYLKKLKTLKKQIEPWVISDHLCWTGIHGRNWHDLLPLPMTEKMISHLVPRIKQVQEILETQIALENASTYLRFREDAMTEWDFLSSVSEEANCLILLDVNNIYVNAFNHKFNPNEYIRKVPRQRVVQYHLAGHTDCGTFRFDTHDAPVIDPVWDLFRYAVEVIGPRPFIVEWDGKIPALSRVEEEAFKALALIEQREIKKYANA